MHTDTHTSCDNADVPDQNSATGTRTRVARMRAEYPNQLDYSGDANMKRASHILLLQGLSWNIMAYHGL